MTGFNGKWGGPGRLLNRGLNLTFITHYVPGFTARFGEYMRFLLRNEKHITIRYFNYF